MSEKFPQILVVPIDNRPVCYDLIHYAANIYKNANILMPDISLLGDLNVSAKTEKIISWTTETVKNVAPDIAILSLDTIAYGGLIPSRRTPTDFKTVKKIIDDYIKLLKSSNKKIKIYAVSSIMRISDNNSNDEEKSYWDKYGRKIFKFSYLSHKLLHDYDVELETELIHLAQTIPFEVIDDYLNTRKRNYEMNSHYIDLVKKGMISQLVLSQDDTAEFGFNVEEKELLQKQALKELVSDKVTIKTGADEMVLSLLAKALVDFNKEKITIEPVFFNPLSKNIISRYEDVSIEKSVASSIKICGGTVSAKNSNMKLLINAPNKVQDELSLCIYEDEKSNVHADRLISYINNSDDSFMIADIKCANGADNYFLNEFLNIPFNPDKFYGFAAWNTTGNTLGTVIAIGIIKYLAEKNNCYDENEFKKSQYVRFLDDWAYQANVRKVLRHKGSEESINEDMKDYQDRISNYLNFHVNTFYILPWNRTFEVKINMTE